MDAGFFEIGLPHLGVEALVVMVNKLFMHYECKTATGRFMRQSYFLLYVELGLSFQPLHESFQQYGYLATHSWMEMLWEKLSMFGLHTVVADVCRTFPREGDQFIMQVLIKAGYKGDSLQRLNRVRIYLQVLFMSDVLIALGCKICPNALSRRPIEEKQSTMRWPIKHPTNSDMTLWRAAKLAICPS